MAHQPKDEKKLSKDVKTFHEKLEEMPFQMRAFSLSLRSLYVKNAVGSDKAIAVKFRELRDDTRNDAMVYLKCLLPLSTVFVRSIKEFFEFFEALSFEAWKGNLSEIKHYTLGYIGVCEALLKGHEELLVPLKKRKDQAKLILSQFKTLEKEYENKIKSLQHQIKKERDWALGLAFVPGIGGLISSSLVAHDADKKMVEALAAKAQAEIDAAAAMVVQNVLIPAIEHYITGLTTAAGFFSIMQQDLQTFEEQASSHSGDHLFYTIMKSEANQMNNLCQEFFAVLPAVRTDFQAIPTEGTDRNYVDKWLEKQKKIIEEKCPVRRFADEMLKAITE